MTISIKKIKKKVITIQTVTRVVIDELVAGLAGTAERVRQIDTDLRTASVVDQTFIHVACFLFLVLRPGTVHFLVAHLLQRYAYTTSLIVAAVELGEWVTFVHRFF